MALPLTQPPAHASPPRAATIAATSPHSSTRSRAPSASSSWQALWSRAQVSLQDSAAAPRSQPIAAHLTVGSGGT